MVDLQTYRCRIGCFATSNNTDQSDCMCKSMNGAVSFIDDLLLMSGVEPNPGPKDKFIFRLQYLLVQVGTEVLRSVFDDTVNPDFVTFLYADTARSKQLQYLILKGVISAEQERVLPPVDMNPNSSNYDITLLAVLLRNVCGLRKRDDPVWTVPAPGDMSIEADITRLRHCRNDLQHRGTVVMSETEFDDKWKELCKILHRLNMMTGGPQLLQSMITKAETDALDEQLKEKLEATIKAWKESDKQLQQQIDQLKVEVTNVRSEVTAINIKVDKEMKDVNDTISQSHIEVKRDFTEVNKKIAELDIKQQRVADHSDKVHRKVDAVKEEVGEMKCELKEQKDKVIKVESRLDNVEQEVKNHHDSTHTVQNELVAVKGEVDRVEKKLVVVTDNVKEDVRQVKSDVTEVKHEVVEMKTRLDNVQQNVQLQPSTECTEVQKDLISMYKSKFKALPVSPLFENKDENILKMYQRPTMWSMEGEKQQQEITYYQDIFYKEGKLCNQICIRGDAGLGKTSLCRFISFLWSVGKHGGHLDEKDEIIQNDIDTLSNFDFLFYINLRDTECCDVIDMIKGNYMRDYDSLVIRNILRTQQCLILMDGLDEWDPIKSGKRRLKLPNMMHSENCVYLMTSRPYRLESNRLSKSDCDHYIQTKGFEEKTTIKSYVNNVISYMNKEHSVNKTVDSFLRDVKKCGLNDHLCIPIMLSHLVVLWFEKGLTAMTRALVYGNILEMLFQRADIREVEFPPITESKWHLPKSFSGFEFLNKYVSLLYNICHLSFRTFFKLDEHSSGLVFTRQQLRSKPYCFSNEESDFLCKIGILSKNELFGWMSEEKMKISFIHKSYIELFASMFVTSFDSNSEFQRVIQTWGTLNEVVGFENFFILLAGLSYDKLKTSIENVYKAVSENIDHLRRNTCDVNLLSLQKLVTKCYKEIKRYNQTNIALHLEDYIFYHLDSNDEDILKELLLLNKTHIKYLHNDVKYHREFDQITTLHYLFIDYNKVFDTRFTECMLRSASTLNTLCIDRSIDTPPLLELPLSSLQCLTSLTLSCVRMSHDNYHNLMTTLSEKVTMETIDLYKLKCHTHESEYGVCGFTLNLGNHSKLSSLTLFQVNITCNTVNTSSLKSVALRPSSHRSVLSSYGDILNCLKFSQLEELYINGWNMLDDNTLTTLRCLNSLRLWNMALPVGMDFLLHPDIKQTEINLFRITMSRQCFHSFIDSFRNNTSVIKVELVNCTIIAQEQGMYNTMSEEESVKCMSEHLSKIQTINITYRYDSLLHFQTIGRQ